VIQAFSPSLSSTRLLSFYRPLPLPPRLIGSRHFALIIFFIPPNFFVQGFAPDRRLFFGFSPFPTSLFSSSPPPSTPERFLSAAGDPRTPPNRISQFPVHSHFVELFFQLRGIHNPPSISFTPFFETFRFQQSSFIHYARGVPSRFPGVSFAVSHFLSLNVRYFSMYGQSPSPTLRGLSGIRDFFIDVAAPVNLILPFCETLSLPSLSFGGYPSLSCLHLTSPFPPLIVDLGPRLLKLLKNGISVQSNVRTVTLSSPVVRADP